MYRLLEFTVNYERLLVPVYEAQVNWGYTAPSGLTTLPGGGVIDSFGDAANPTEPKVLTYSGVLVTATPDGLRREIDKWMGRIGEQGMLIRRPLANYIGAGGAPHGIKAKLLDAYHPSGVNPNTRHIPLQLTWELKGAWNGIPVGFESRVNRNATITINSNRLTIPSYLAATVGTGITSVRFVNDTPGANTDIYIEPYPVGIGAVSVIEINPQALSVKQDNGAIYDKFSFMPMHKRAEWFVLLRGSNRLRIETQPAGALVHWTLRAQEAWR